MPVCDDCGRNFEEWYDEVWGTDDICEECYNEEDEDFYDNTFDDSEIED